MPLYDWECMAHGKFEAFVGKCPHGCGSGMVRRLPVLQLNIGSSDKTKFVDQNMNALAKQFGVTDLNNKNGTGNAVASDYRWNNSDEIMKKRLSGQTYSMPIDHSVGVSVITGQAGASSSGNIAATMKEEGRLVPNIKVIANDHVKINKSDLK